MRVGASGLRYRNEFVAVKRSELPVVPWVSNSAFLCVSAVIVFYANLPQEADERRAYAERNRTSKTINTQINMLLSRCKEL